MSMPTATLLFVMAATISSSYSFYLHHCEWAADETALHQPFDLLPVATEEFTKDINITEDISNIEVLNLDASLHDYYAFPYFIRMRVKCENEFAYRKARALLATGTIPKVTVQYHVHTADGSSDGAHEDTYIAVAIDEELGNCEYSLCKPSWLVPWGRADGSQVMQIQISTEGLGMLWQIKSKTLQVGNHDTKTELTALASFEVGLLGNLSNVAAELDSGWMHETQNMQGQSLVLVLGGFLTSNLIIYSHDDFLTSDIIELTILDGVAMASVCDDTMGIPASRVTGAASLYNKLILKTNAGLFELKADFQRDGSKFITQFPAANILSKCIAELVISPQSLSVDKIVLAIGAPPHSGEVYFVKANNATGQHYDFQPLEDSRARKVCDAVSGMYDTCSVVSGSVSAVKPSAIVLLVKVNDTYKTVEFFNDSWDVQAEFSSFLPASKAFQMLDANTEYTTDPLVLTHISFLRQIGSDLFLWGNVILHSPDGGKTISMLDGYHGNSNIVILTSAGAGLFAILTENLEIWLGYISGNSVEQLRPSAAWDIVHSLHEESYIHTRQHANLSTITVMYTGRDELIEVIACHDDNGDFKLTRHNIPVADITRHRVFQSRMLATVNRQELSNSDAAEVTVQRSCAFTSLTYEMERPQYFTRTQKYQLAPPRLSMNDSLHRNGSLLLFQVVANLLLSEMYNQPQRSHYGYQTIYPSFADEWRDVNHGIQMYHEYLFRNHMLNDSILLSFHDNYKVYETDKNTIGRGNLPAVMFLGSGITYNFTIEIIVAPIHAIRTSPDTQTPMQMVSAMFIVSDTSLLEVSATREDLYVRRAVLYRVSIRDKGLRRSQALPGSELHPVSLRIQVSNSVGCCFTSSQDERLFMGMQHTTIMLGCPPGQKLMFDVDASLAVTKPYDCLVPIENMPCFYYAEGFYPRFVIMDRIQRTYHNFTGSYILTVVGGGSGGESNVRLYTDEEIQTYNNQDSSDATLIWGPLAEDMDRAVPVFNQKSNGISWLCQKKSPCANIAPKFPASPEYFFLINVTNRDVDINSTNCIYTTQFLIRIHGLPMDSIKGSLFITCFTIFLICLFIVIYGICKRNDEKIYKRFKDSVYDRIYMKLKPVKKLNSTEIAVQVLKKQAAAARQQRFMIQQQGQWSWTKAMPELGELDEMSESENEGSSDSSGIILPASTVNPTESSDAVLPAVDLPKQ